LQKTLSNTWASFNVTCVINLKSTL
jgi:hypothetical protein